MRLYKLIIPLVTHCGRSRLGQYTTFSDCGIQNKLAPNQKELWKRSDEVLYYVWDPIGIANAPSARDKYGSYAPHISALVDEDAPPSKIADALVRIKTDSMGMGPGRKKSLGVAEILLEYRERINATVTRKLLGAQNRGAIV